MTPLEMTAVLLIGLLTLILVEVTILYIYHYYFLVPLFKLMSYQSGVDIPSSFDSAFTQPTLSKAPKKEPRKALQGKDLADMMDKLTNAF
jgi:hypothetical protein